MKLLLVNGNITQAVTDLVQAEALRHARTGTEVTAVTATFGVLSSRPNWKTPSPVTPFSICSRSMRQAITRRSWRSRSIRP